MTKIVLAFDKSILTALDADILEQVAPHLGMIKVGLEAITARAAWGGSVADAVQEQMSTKIPVLYDGKFHDIGNTMARAAENLFGLYAGFTMHASASIPALKQVVAAKNEWVEKTGKTPPIIFGVTILTDFDDDDCHSVYADASVEVVCDFAWRLLEAGVDGLVCSPRELPLLKERDLLQHLTTLVPGVRPKWAKANDQKRTMTPKEAADLGADYIVVGRPVWDGPYSPAEGVRLIGEEIARK
jgi:orotidine-5'-phosphate decarboxylase